MPSMAGIVSDLCHHVEVARLHEAFLYDIGDVGDGTAEAPPPRTTRTTNPYSKLGVEIMDAVRRNHLAMSPSIIAYLKMPIMLATAAREPVLKTGMARHVLLSRGL